LAALLKFSAVMLSAVGLSPGTHSHIAVSPSKSCKRKNKRWV